MGLKGVLIGIGLLLAGVPVGSAGTFDHPELPDAREDASAPLPHSVGDYPDTPVAQRGESDILGAWFWGEGPDELHVAMAVAALRPETKGTYELKWLADSWNHGSYRYHLRATVEGAEELLERVEPSPRPLEGQVTRGAPGNITWHIPKDGNETTANDTVLMHFEATGHVQITGDSAFQDWARNSTNAFVVGDYHLIALPAFDLPGRPADVATGALGGFPPWQLGVHGAWLDASPPFVNVTLQGFDLTMQGLRHCAIGYEVAISFYESTPQQVHRLKLRALFKPRPTGVFGTPDNWSLDGSAARELYGNKGWDEDFEILGPEGLHALPTAPAFVRLQVPRTLWSGGDDWNSIGFEALAECGGDWATRMGVYRRAADTGLPSVGASGLALAMVCAVLARRRIPW